MRQFHWLLILFCLVGFSCQTRQNLSSDSPLFSDTIRYAQGFSIHRFADYTEVEVRDPWDSTRLLQRYLLVDRERPLPTELPKGTVVRVPAQHVVVYTSVHAAILEQLGETGRIVGVCESRYMDLPSIQAGLKSGQIADIGEATAPNVEKMIERKAELVIVSPFQNSGYGPVEKLGIPIVEGADYMESLPLGRTEWIRFYGWLFGKEAVADSIFRATEQRYLALKARITDEMPRPIVLAEKRFGSSWFVPAGDSYMAHLFQDAGADYIFRELPGSGSVPLTFETVLDRAIHADLWLLKYNQSYEMTYGDLRAEYTPYENFDAFKNRHIYTCNTGIVPYYEEFPLHPDYLLKDLISLFHPELWPDYAPRYYRKMQE